MRQRPSDLTAVILWMTGALLSFSATAVGVRAVAPALGLFDTLAARNAAGFAVVAAVAFLRRGAQPFVARRLGLHLLRNLVHFSAIYGWSLGLTLLPFATVFALEFTAPAWVTLLAALILRERLTAPRLVAVVLGILGVLVILRPGAEAFDPAALSVLWAAFGFAAVTIITKKLTATETTLTILFWMNLMQLPMNLVASALSPPVAHVPFTAWHGLALALVCTGGLSSHWCLTNAYQHGDAITVLPLDFLRVPLIALVGWAFYGERLEIWLFLGAGLILAGILFNLRAEARARPAPA